MNAERQKHIIRIVVSNEMKRTNAKFTSNRVGKEHIATEDHSSSFIPLRIISKMITLDQEFRQ